MGKAALSIPQSHTAMFRITRITLPAPRDQAEQFLFDGIRSIETNLEATVSRYRAFLGMQAGQNAVNQTQSANPAGNAGAQPAPAPVVNKTGRPPMTEAQRRASAKRMKAFWAKKRLAEQAAAGTPNAKGRAKPKTMSAVA